MLPHLGQNFWAAVSLLPQPGQVQPPDAAAAAPSGFLLPHLGQNFWAAVSLLPHLGQTQAPDAAAAMVRTGSAWVVSGFLLPQYRQKRWSALSMVPQLGHFQPAGATLRLGMVSGRLAPQVRQNFWSAGRTTPQLGQVQPPEAAPAGTALAPKGRNMARKPSRARPAHRNAGASVLKRMDPAGISDAMAAGMALSIDVLTFDTSTRNSTSMIRAKIT